jgi:hypothetical protein
MKPGCSTNERNIGDYIYISLHLLKLMLLAMMFIKRLWQFYGTENKNVLPSSQTWRCIFS